jgi:hypothetical protein
MFPAADTQEYASWPGAGVAIPLRPKLVVIARDSPLGRNGAVSSAAGGARPAREAAILHRAISYAMAQVDEGRHSIATECQSARCALVTVARVRDRRGPRHMRPSRCSPGIFKQCIVRRPMSARPRPLILGKELGRRPNPEDGV